MVRSISDMYRPAYATASSNDSYRNIESSKWPFQHYSTKTRAIQICQICIRFKFATKILKYIIERVVAEKKKN